MGGLAYADMDVVWSGMKDTVDVFGTHTGQSPAKRQRLRKPIKSSAPEAPATPDASASNILSFQAEKASGAPASPDASASSWMVHYELHHEL